MASELYLMEVGDGRYSILLCDDGSITQMPELTPAETLIAFSELDYAGYRKVVRWLRNEHPLFEERIDIPVSDLEDFAAEAILLTPDLCEIDPVSGFVVTDILHRTLQAEDDGTAMFLLAAGQEILRVMEEPLRVQNYLRNIMEVAFDSTAGMTPAEQYENLRAAYADIARICDPAKLPQLEEPRSFRLRSLMELRMLVLALYFEQDNQRVCRCDYCWGYFIPKTKKATRYCDRVTDGQSCKQRGANLARLDKTSEDEALLICKKAAGQPIINTSFEGLETRRCQSPISARNAENIAITGHGVFDGNGDTWRPTKKDKLTEGQWKKIGRLRWCGRCRRKNLVS